MAGITITGSLVFGAAGDALAASIFKMVHNFCAWPHCDDGEAPDAALLMDSAGTFYGTASIGGKYAGGFELGGVVFKIDLEAGKYKEHVLKNFCKQASCSDGEQPESDLIIDTAGNLYGTTAAGGQHGDGVVFRLMPNGTGWNYTVLHDFKGSDGNQPNVGLTYAGQTSGAAWDGSSPLYGTTSIGGTDHKGVVYELKHTGANWSLTVIHDFQGAKYPNAVLMDSAGNLLGTAAEGGNDGGGILFKLANGTWTETTLHSFCKEAQCADGENPVGRLFMDGSGNLFGVTISGGSTDNGVAFERTSSGTFKVMYNFCSLANCLDGAVPEAGLLMDSAGNLFGTTSEGGSANGGVIFELMNSNGTSTETALHSFCGKANCTDGAIPFAPVILDGSDDLFGTTTLGGKYGSYGTVFEFKP